jgi:hypothetical protein
MLLMRGVHFFFILILLYFYSPPCYAETIKLKNSKVIEAKILEQADNYVKVDVSGIALTYYYDEIESIDGQSRNTGKKDFVGNASLTPLEEKRVLAENIKKALQNVKKSSSFSYPTIYLQNFPGFSANF